MVHHFDPFLWQISGEFGIRWYGLSYLAGFIIAYLMMSWLAPKQRMGLTREQVGDFITYCVFGTLIGGRLGYCIFYSPDLFTQFKGDFPFWGVLAVNEGGMASHGGMIGLVIGAILFARKTGIRNLYLFDLMAVSGPIGVFFGRIANFINGELVGRPADPSYPLAVKFPQDIYSWPSQEVSRLPGLSSVIEKLNPFSAELSARLGGVAQISKDTWLEWMDRFRMDGAVREKVSAVLHEIVRQIQDGNTQAQAAIGELLTPRHPSQLYGALGEGLFVFLCLFFLWRRPRKPGVIAACFIVLYAIVRILDEHFRMPDAHIGFQLFGLTRGQWLSVAMLIVGLVMMFVWNRGSSMSVPGWGKERDSDLKIRRRS